MKLISLAVFLFAITSFWWARKSFFRRDPSTSRWRGGLAPLGTIFAATDSYLLASTSALSFLAFVLGTVAIGLSLVVFWYAIGSFNGLPPRIAHTPGVAEKINVSGPYRFVRHPFYLSYALCWIGAALYLMEGWGTFLASFFAAVMIRIYYKTACAEELELLNSDTGAQYQKYKDRTGMFLPRLAGLSRDG